MKKLFVLAGLMIGLSANAQWSYYVTNFQGETWAKINPGISNIIVSEITVTAGSNAVNAQFYDNSVGSNWIYRAAFNSILSYTTNIVGESNILTSGLTNISTNVGITFVTVVNTAGNRTLDPIAVVAIPANTSITVPVDSTVTRGVALASGATTSNATVIVRYRSWK